MVKIRGLSCALFVLAYMFSSCLRVDAMADTTLPWSGHSGPGVRYVVFSYTMDRSRAQIFMWLLVQPNATQCFALI